MDIIKTANELADILNKKGLSYINVKDGDVEIQVAAKTPESAYYPMTASMPVTETAVPAAEPVKPEKSGNYVTSPIVGTFYSKPAPEKPPFVQVGDRVKKGQVICIVESMKLMNEITCDYDGTVAAILAMDGDAVDFGKELIRIE